MRKREVRNVLKSSFRVCFRSVLRSESILIFVVWKILTVHYWGLAKTLFLNGKEDLKSQGSSNMFRFMAVHKALNVGFHQSCFPFHQRNIA